MNDQFVNWDDLDLDSLLGEYTDEDGELEVEIETSSPSENDDEHNNHDDDAADLETENIRPQPKSKKAKTNGNLYTCPICQKEYKSASGFRGHVSKKHNKPELKAHQHMKNAPEQTTLPAREIPVTTDEQIRKEMPCIIKSSLQDIATDACHSLPSSVKGPSMITFAAALLAANLTAVCAIFVAHLSVTFKRFGQTSNTTELLIRIAQLRRCPVFMQQIQDSIISTIQLDHRLRLKSFTQRWLTQITTNYFKRQNELMKNIETEDAATVTEEDRQVIYYICGYVVHALRKKYLKLKSNKSELLKCLDNLVTSDSTTSVPSSWTEKMDRGGLKKTRKEFFVIFVQIERWIRDIVSTKRLTTDSLVHLKTTLMDYNLLQNSWKKMFPNATTIEWTVLEHSIALFLKVRGFAVTKLVRKKIQLEQKKNKTKAGSKRKALRKELKAMN